MMLPNLAMVRLGILIAWTIASTVAGPGPLWAQAQESTAAEDSPTTGITISKERIERHFKPKPRRSEQPLYTSRPLLAVGQLKEMDRATSSVLVAIDRERSVIPNVLISRARRQEKEAELLDREFPPERRFKLTQRTLYLDARASQKKPETRADTGRIADDEQRLRWEDFQPDDHVTVLYKLRPKADRDPLVLSFSKVDADQKDFELDFNPFGKERVYRRLPAGADGSTTATRVIIEKKQKPSEP